MYYKLNTVLADKISCLFNVNIPKLLNKQLTLKLSKKPEKTFQTILPNLFVDIKLNLKLQTNIYIIKQSHK